jgi:hypothetical protein
LISFMFLVLFRHNSDSDNGDVGSSSFELQCVALGFYSYVRAPGDKKGLAEPGDGRFRWGQAARPPSEGG